MGRNAAIEAVALAEERGRLFQQRVLGYPVWPLERLRRYRLELMEGELIESTGPRAPFSRRLNSVKVPLLQSLRDARELGLPKAVMERDIWVLASSSYRRADARGDLQCIFTEDLREQLGDRVVFLERTTNEVQAKPREDVFHLDALHVSAMLAAKALGPVAAKGGALTKEQRQAFAPMAPGYVCQLAMYGQTMQRIAAGLIEQRRPRAVFVLCGYQPHIPIQRAVRAAGIPLIELQHGLIHDSHPGYALDGGSACDHVPDHLVVFGSRFERIAHNVSSHWRGRTSIGGHPWLRAKSKGVAPLGERSAIVLFSQADQPVRQALRAIATGLVAKRPQGARVIVKPHPRETDGYWDDLGALGIEIAACGADSYSLLRECRVAVAVHSTIALEAPAFGCATTVTHPALWTEDIEAMVEQGALLHVDSAADVCAAYERAPERDAHGDGSGSHARLADELFGISAPPLDYRALIEKLEVVSGGARRTS
jgi:hypothetical protein